MQNLQEEILVLQYGQQLWFFMIRFPFHLVAMGTFMVTLKNRKHINIKLFTGENMRNRVEDIGRILILLEKVMDHSLFCESRMLPVDFSEWFYQQSREVQVKLLDGLAFGVDEVENQMMDILKIAKGEDYLNGSER